MTVGTPGRGTDAARRSRGGPRAFSSTMCARLISERRRRTTHHRLVLCVVLASSLSSPIPHRNQSAMLSRTVLRQAAAQAPKLRVQSVRAASAWSQVPQGPPVRPPCTSHSSGIANRSTGCKLQSTAYRLVPSLTTLRTRPFSVSLRLSRPTATPRRSTLVRTHP